MFKGVLRVFCVICLLSLSVVSIKHNPLNETSRGIAYGKSQLSHDYFIENKGQWSSDILFMGRTEYGYILFTDSSTLHCVVDNDMIHVVEYNYIDMESASIISGENKHVHYSNYINEKGSFSNVGHYAIVKYTNIWDQIDLVFKYTSEGLKYEYYVYPNGDVDKISIDISGGTAEVTERNMSIVCSTTCTLSDIDLVAYTSSFKPVNVSYQITHNTISYNVSEYPKTETLIIDPLIYSTYIGGTTDLYCGEEAGTSIEVDSSGNSYITGYTNSIDFPVTPGSYDTSKLVNDFDAYVIKLNSGGSSLLFSTFVGGSDNDIGCSIKIVTNENEVVEGIVVAGNTESDDFPVYSAYDPTFNGETDVFLFKLTSNGTTLLYSTYIGGSDADDLQIDRSLDLDSSGNPCILGTTCSYDYPTTAGSYKTQWGKTLGSSYIFVTKFNSSASSLIFSTYVGGDADCSSPTGIGLGFDDSNNVFGIGFVMEDNCYGPNPSTFPVTQGAFDTTYNGYGDILVFKLSSSGGSLLASTYLGGSENGRTDITLPGYDMPHSIRVFDNEPYITGYTSSDDYPVTQDSFDTTHNGEYDAFVTVLNSSLSGLAYSTYFGAYAEDSTEDVISSTEGYSIDTDDNGFIYLMGNVVDCSPYNLDFPITQDADYDTISGMTEVFVAKINMFPTPLQPEKLVYCSFYGGSENENCGAYANSPHWTRSYISGSIYYLAEEGHLFVTGGTESDDFPITPGVYDDTYNEGIDIYVFRLQFP